MIEIKGQQLRIRKKNPKHFWAHSFRTQDVGEKGKLQRIGARNRKTNKWETQAWRLNLADYKNKKEADRDIELLRNKKQISAKQAHDAKRKLSLMF